MKINSIQLKVISIIVLILTVTISSVLVFILGNQKKELIKSTERTLSVNTNILNTVIRNIMLSGEAPIATRTVQDLKKLSSLSEVSIYRTDGTVAFNDYKTLDWVNNFQDEIEFEKTDRLDNKIMNNLLFKKVLDTKTPIQNELIKSQELEYYFPILNYGECRTCHGDDEFIRGIAHFKISLKNVYRTINRSRRLYIVIFVSLGILVMLILFISIKKVVLNPIKTIGTVVNDVGNGNLDIEVTIKNRDELGRLGEYINKMIKGLKERNRLMLENRVIEAKNRENKKYLDHLQEGLVLLDRDFIITDNYSLFFKKLFRIDHPEGMHISEIIFPGNPENRADELNSFLSMIMNNLQAEMDMLMDVNPVKETCIKLDNGKQIYVDAYFARIYDNDKNVENIMVIFKDRTKIIKAQNELVIEKLKSQSELEIISAMLQTGTQGCLEFLNEANSLVEKLKVVINKKSEITKDILRDIHTLKGTSRYHGFNRISDVIHSTEDILLDTFDIEKIKLANDDMIIELELIEDLYSKFQSFVTNNKKEKADPVNSFLKSLPKMVKEISDQLGKKVFFVISNELKDLPFINNVKGTIIHLIKNSIDHGIENVQIRAERNKNAEGEIILKLYEDDIYYMIDVVDDGNGLDFKGIYTEAVRKGILNKGDKVNHGVLTKLLFNPLFTSKAEADDISGRGIGLDAVKDQVHKLGGSINIITKSKSGSTFRLRFLKEGKR